MKLKGDFILREVAGETILIPVGAKALEFNGILTLNEVAVEIWKDLRDGKSREQILENILDQFDVSSETASADLDEFLQLLQEKDFLEI